MPDAPKTEAELNASLTELLHIISRNNEELAARLERMERLVAEQAFYAERAMREMRNDISFAIAQGV